MCHVSRTRKDNGSCLRLRACTLRLRGRKNHSFLPPISVHSFSFQFIQSHLIPTQSIPSQLIPSALPTQSITIHLDSSFCSAINHVDFLAAIPNAVLALPGHDQSSLVQPAPSGIISSTFLNSSTSIWPCALFSSESSPGPSKLCMFDVLRCG